MGAVILVWVIIVVNVVNSSYMTPSAVVLGYIDGAQRQSQCAVTDMFFYLHLPNRMDFAPALYSWASLMLSSHLSKQACAGETLA